MNDYEANAERTCERIPMPDEPTKEARTFQGMNTDREIWRRVPGDYYSPTIHVTAGGEIGVNVGGLVYVRSAEEWHKAMRESLPPQQPGAAMRVDDARAKVIRARLDAGYKPNFQDGEDLLADRADMLGELARLRDENAKLKGA